MSAGAILTLGLGVFGGVGKLVTLGYTPAVVEETPVFTTGNARIGIRIESVDAARIGVVSLSGGKGRIGHG